ncbi:MAG: ABC transporter permease [Oscillatoriales cyanobacterium]|nr:MAG: ABC transporter permease [Oscillatoriales cyanobacterium]
MTKIKLDLFVRAIAKKWLWVQAALAFAFLYLPILILIIYSFNSSKFNAVWRGFTLDWYGSLFSNAGATLATSSSAGILPALSNSLLHFPGRKAVEALLFLPIIMPEITIGISLLVFFTLAFRIVENLTGIRLNLGLPTVIIGHVVFNISFVTITVRARLAELDPQLEQAAFDLGANEWRTFWRITLPLILPAIFSAALLAFTLSLDDFVVTFFTTGVGSMTLPLLVYGMIKFAVTPAINAISTLMLLASLLLVVSSLRVKRS